MSADRVRLRRPEDAAAMVGWLDQTGVPVPPPAGTEPLGEQVLVLIDATDRPLACLRLRERLGLQLPRYSYHLGRVVHAAAELQLFSAQPTLLLGNDHTGESELSELACAPQLDTASRTEALRCLVSEALARITARRDAFAGRVVVELAGVRDGQGRSPFWDGLGGLFYSGDPAEAQARWGEAWRSHLAGLLPRQTLYLSFLSEAAQAAVGQVGESGQAAAQALRACGFNFADHVRIDDGGALLELKLDRH